MQRESSSSSFPIGSKMPEFLLPSTDGKVVAPPFFAGARAALVVFTCNHCPYVKGSDQMLLKILKKYSDSDLKTVAISANDALEYPEDSFELMKAKVAELQLPFPYLYDESQEVARKFDAACTPELFLFNSKLELCFHGTINDSPRDPSQVKQDYLSRAIDQVLAGSSCEPSYVHPIGCSIKWAHR